MSREPRDYRYQTQVHAKFRPVRDREAAIVTGETTTLSATGLSLRATAACAVGTLLDVELATDDGAFVRFEGVVTWSRPDGDGHLLGLKVASRSLQYASFIKLAAAAG